MTQKPNFPAIEADIQSLRDFRDGRLTALSGLKWFYGTFGEHLDADHAPGERNYCGTSACAAGIMALRPGSPYEAEWKDGGLSIRFGNSEYDYAIAKNWKIQVFYEYSNVRTREFERLNSIFCRQDHSSSLDYIIELLETFQADLLTTYGGEAKDEAQ